MSRLPRRWLMLSSVAIVLAVLVTSRGVSGQAGKAPPQAPPKPAPKALPAAPAAAPAGPVIVMETVRGTIEFETFPQEAPKTVQHVLALVQRNFYNGLRFHRVEPNFVIQIGDPATRDMTKRVIWGRGNSGSQIGVGEFSKKRSMRYRRARRRTWVWSTTG